MSWIKPNFLWMMYRSGWGCKPGQEVILAVRLHRQFFDKVLQQAVPSSFDHNRYSNHTQWKQAVQNSNVRLQWDPDHDPSGRKESRRAVQLGLRGTMLEEYSKSAIVEIIDVSDFVRQQRLNIHDARYAELVTPREEVVNHAFNLA